MTPAQRRALDRVHDNEAQNATDRTLLVAVWSRGGYPEDSLARGQAHEELALRGVSTTCTMILPHTGEPCGEPAVVPSGDGGSFCAECAEWGL